MLEAEEPAAATGINTGAVIVSPLRVGREGAKTERVSISNSSLRRLASTHSNSLAGLYYSCHCTGLLILGNITKIHHTRSYSAIWLRIVIRWVHINGINELKVVGVDFFLDKGTVKWCNMYSTKDLYIGSLQ